MEKRDRVRLLASIILVGFLAAVAFHGTLRLVFHAGYPQNTFLFRPDDRFNDFYNPIRGSADRDPYNPDRILYIGGYFPFGYLVTYLFSRIEPEQRSLTLFLVSFLALLGVYIASALAGTPSPHGVKSRLSIFGYALCIAYLAYPTIFLVDRANFDAVVFVLIAGFALLYQRGNVALAVAILSPAIAMKGYPAILLTLPLIDRRFKELMLACLLTCLLSLGALAVFSDGLVVEAHKMLVSFQRASAIAFDGGSLVRFNSSLYTALLYILGRAGVDPAYSPIFDVGYLVMIASVWAACTVALRRWSAPFWARLSVVTALMILLPPSSADYRLIMLYPALMAFLNNSVTNKDDWFQILVFGLLMVPKAYLILESDINMGLLLNPLLLAALLVSTLALVRPGPRGTPRHESTSVLAGG
jgi:hypothetical protein